MRVGAAAAAAVAVVVVVARTKLSSTRVVLEDVREYSSSDTAIGGRADATAG